MTTRVLIVDDKESIRTLLSRLLTPSCEVSTAEHAEAALERLRSDSFDVVVSDIRMPGMDGLALLRAAKAIDPDLEIILMTAYASVQSAVEAIREGAFDYLPKPFDADEAVLKVQRAAERKSLKDQTKRLLGLLESHTFEGMIGRSPAMARVFSLIDKAARRDLTVLLLGPSGTGKELAARAIHLRSSARAEPFVAVNCGAIPADLMESELFGHVRGAFSGASGDKRGLFEEAHRGTIFLDELGEMPLPLQVKLNRALQERELRRVGDTRTRPLTARVIAATNRDLQAEVKAGRFREDLYYRLAVFPIELPPLIEREGDVPLLAHHFLARANKRMRGGPEGFKPEALRAILNYPWPGNVRELENAIERAAAIAEGTLIANADLPDALQRKSPPVTTKASLAKRLIRLPWRDAMERVERKAARVYFKALLKRTKGNVSEAAERAGLARESLHRLLRKYSISPEKFRRLKQSDESL